jgi:cobaltochelatase CobT
MAGVADNLDALLDERCRAKGFASVTDRNDANLADVISLLAREQMTGIAPPAAAGRMVDIWRSWLEKRIGQRIRRMGEVAQDQESYAAVVKEIIHDLDLVDDDAEPTETDDDRDDDQEARRG